MPGMSCLILLVSFLAPLHPMKTLPREWLRPPVTHFISEPARWTQSEFGVPPRPLRRRRLDLLLAALR
jgi:hypothetical protein